MKRKLSKRQWECDVLSFLTKHKEESEAESLLNDYSELEARRIMKRQNKKKVEGRNKITGNEKLSFKRNEIDSLKRSLTDTLTKALNTL